MAEQTLRLATKAPPKEELGLGDIPVEEIVVTPAASEAKSAIGTKEFNSAFSKEMASGQPWRTPSSLASKLGVDAVDLVKWMDTIPDLVRKPSKEDGVFYYGFAARPTEDREKRTRPVVSEEDRYAAASLHLAYGQLLRAAEKYALRVHDKSPEAFAALAAARDRLSVATLLFNNAIKVDPDKLPKL